MADGLISCDDHMDLGQLPADLWETRLPVSLRERAPHVEERGGQAMWICDGKAWGRWDGKPPATGSARRSSRSTPRSTAPAFTITARGGRPMLNCALPTWIATGCRPS